VLAAARERPIRLVLADDHRLVVEAVRARLKSDDRFELVKFAFDGAEAVELAGELSPDVILMDLDMPGLDGIEAMRRICEAAPSARVLILTAADAPGDSAGARQAGAVGFLRKDRSAAQVLDILEISSLLLAAAGADPPPQVPTRT
jgi:two-component system response regulator DesR